MNKPNIEIHGHLGLSLSTIEEIIYAVMSDQNQTSLIAELDIQALDKKAMQVLNYEYRHKDYPTNILSFPHQHQQDKHLFLGDLVLCPDLIAEEAQRAEIFYEQHITHLLVHGLLHLFNYDHENDHDASIMEVKEIAILKQLNQPNPYSGST